MTKLRQIDFYNIGLYVLGFILFWEWLRPLEIVTDTANSIYFVIFAGSCFLLYFLRIPFWLSSPLRFVFLLYILHALFFEGSFFNVEWLYGLYGDVALNTQSLLNSQWMKMSDLFRTFLFLILLWVMGYLIHYWLIQAKRIFGFYILTIIYLGVLDTFTKYDASAAIVRTIIIGFLLMGCMQMFRLKEKEGIKVRPFWLAALSVVIAISVSIGFYAPKAGPQWPDPVPFIKSAAKGQILGNGVNKIGYGVDDSKLGGAFVNDNTTVFTAEAKEAHYWRIEAKDYYTGKGWITAENFPRTLIDKDNIYLSILENVNREYNAKAKVTIENIGYYPHIAYPVDLRKIETDQRVQVLAERFSGKLFTEKNGDSIQLNSYVMTYDVPTFSIEALKLANGGDNPYIIEIYTQLPDELPERVKNLAAEITKGKATRYEKAKAIESYFAAQGFIYETSDVAIPEEDQDYVDQFLFDTKKGYCDNFSTSMAVLLRSLNIPARWVKGYTQGDYIKTLKDGYRLYEVKNSNAHSWVEVYFPGIGWVPFEPTQGFTNLNAFTETALPAESQINREVDEEVKQNESEQEKKESEQTKRNDHRNVNLLKNLNLPVKEICIYGGLVLLLGGLLFKYKTKWYPYWVIMNYRLRKNRLDPKLAFKTLFLLLENKGFKIQGGETLREYAVRVDEKLGNSEMKELTEIYEKLIYADNRKKVEDWDTFSKLWENLIKKI